MGYTITIGNAVPVWEPEDEYCSWTVEKSTLDDAPVFSNDEMTGNGNDRSPSYTGWSEFTKWAGLHDLFFADWHGLMASHPGVHPLRQHHLEIVRGAKKAVEAKHSDLRPGFALDQWEIEHKRTLGKTIDDYPYRLEDANYARLVWLDWWMDWALRTCERPAIGNT